MSKLQSAGPASSESDEARRKAEELMLQSRMSDIRHKLLVLSGKGGVGKSTVAVNLAAALAGAGKKAGLLDVDVHGPSIPTLLGLEGRSVQVAGGDFLPLEVNDNFAVMSMGFLLSAKDAVIWRGPRKYHMIRQFLKDVAWGKLDYLVIDSPPGTGDEPLSVAQLAGTGARAIIVTTPQNVALADVRRCVAFCRTLALPILGIIENMSGLVCPKCGEQIDLFKKGGGMALATDAGIAALGQIPIDLEVVISGDAGRPLSCEYPRSPAAAAFADIVNTILMIDAEPPSVDATNSAEKQTD